MGTVRGGGLGCTCPENAFLKALLRHLILEREEIVIMDMEAGIEHLGRGTTEGIDILVVVVEPSLKSIETVERIAKLSTQIGIKNIKLVGNKVKGEDSKTLLIRKLKDFDFIGFLSYNEDFYLADISSSPVWQKLPQMLEEGEVIVDKLLNLRVK